MPGSFRLHGTIAGTLQSWYEKIYDQTPPSGWKTPLLIRVSWVVGLGVYLFLQVQVGQHVGPASGHVLIFGAVVGRMWNERHTPMREMT